MSAREAQTLTGNSELLKTWGPRRETQGGWLLTPRWKTVYKANPEQGNQLWTRERFIRFQEGEMSIRLRNRGIYYRNSKGKEKFQRRAGFCFQYLRYSQSVQEKMSIRCLEWCKRKERKARKTNEGWQCVKPIKWSQSWVVSPEGRPGPGGI